MLNYRHLYYFWVVTKEGGFARAAARLDMAVQTISAQVRELERSFGHQLLKPAGRGVALTEAGQAAFSRAEEIFRIGSSIPDEVRGAATGQVARLAVGLSDGLSKFARLKVAYGKPIDIDDLHDLSHRDAAQIATDRLMSAIWALHADL